MKQKILICALALLASEISSLEKANAYCGQATHTSVASIDNTSARIEWTPINGIVGYTFRYHKIGSPTWNYVPSNLPYLEVTDLSPSVDYEYQVQTVCNGTTSPFSESNKFTTLTYPNVAPVFQPGNVVTGTSATINWSTVPGACTYQVQWKLASSNGWTTVSGLTSPTYSLRSLVPCTSYQMRVRTVCPMFTSAFSSVTTFNTICPTTGGTQTGSRLLKIDGENPLVISLYPNPVREKLNIEFQSEFSGTVNTNVYNMIGKIVLNSTMTIQEGNNVLSVNTDQLAEGIYFFEMEKNGDVIRRKFMVSN